MDSTVSLLVEVPEVLHDSIEAFLRVSPGWDQDRIFAAALSLFLLQNRTSEPGVGRESYRQTARIYLDNVFKKPSEDTEDA